VIIKGTDLTQHVSRRHGQVKGELGGQVLVRKAPNAIGAKESSSHTGEPLRGDNRGGLEARASPGSKPPLAG